MLQKTIDALTAVIPFAHNLLSGGQIGALKIPPNISSAAHTTRIELENVVVAHSDEPTVVSSFNLWQQQQQQIRIERKSHRDSLRVIKSGGIGVISSSDEDESDDDDCASREGGHPTQKRCDDRSVPIIAQLMTILSYALLMVVGHIREGYRSVRPDPGRVTRPGYASLVRDFDDFFTRRIYTRIRDCWNRPLDTRPGRTCGVMERVSTDNNNTFEFTGRSIPCVNMASYNYLGFAEDMPSITDDNLEALERYGIGSCASSVEGGRSDIVRQLEQETAAHVGKEDAVVYAMGFGTNFSGLPALFAGPGSLIVSDSLNHASLVAGTRLSSGRVKIFPHNDFHRLEAIIREAIVDGQPRTHRPWKRIILLVEGVYSMEGEILNLNQIVRLKKKYNCLLYIDEAHSIGALGATGRGVCEHFGVAPADVDVLMGTYTKSFGSIGGYIAADASVISFMRRASGASLIGDTLHSAACQQALSSLRVMQGKDGTTTGRDKVAQLAVNAKYLRRGLIDLGFQVYGDDDSPVIPMMIFNPGKLSAFSRECLKRNLAVVVVGYPATSLIESRVRFCVSAAHTRADLDRVLATVDEVAGLIPIRYRRSMYLFC